MSLSIKELENKIGSERVDELRHYWHTETDEEYMQDWRNELTSDEEKIVAAWDNQYNIGIAKICQQILELERGNVAKFRGQEPERSGAVKSAVNILSRKAQSSSLVKNRSQKESK